MKKQEWIHLHGLLAQVQDHYEENTGNKAESDEYLGLGVQPTSIHKSKTDHKEAVFALAEGITSEMEDPGSTEADFETYYEAVLEEALEQYRRRRDYDQNMEEVTLSLGRIPLTQMQAEHVAVNSEVEYRESTIGGKRLAVPTEKVEEWTEETCEELD